MQYRLQGCTHWLLSLHASWYRFWSISPGMMEAKQHSQYTSSLDRSAYSWGGFLMKLLPQSHLRCTNLEIRDGRRPNRRRQRQPRRGITKERRDDHLDRTVVKRVARRILDCTGILETNTNYVDPALAILAAFIRTFAYPRFRVLEFPDERSSAKLVCQISDESLVRHSVGGEKKGQTRGRARDSLNLVRGCVAATLPSQ